MRPPAYPKQDLATKEWHYQGVWYDYFPSEEMERDEAEFDDSWDRELERMREEGRRHER